MNESHLLKEFQTTLAELIERGKQVRNQFTSTRSLTSIDASDAAQRLTILAVDLANLAVSLKQSSLRAAEDARNEIR